jgi:probable HAF family extracellular repeat protein
MLVCMRLGLVVMVVVGCGDNPAAPPDASGGDPGTRDASVDGPSVDGPSVDGPSVDGPSVDGPSVDAAGPPLACTRTTIVIPNNRGSQANAIDGAGNIAGQYVLATGATHAFRWHASTGFVDLGTLGGDFATALGVSGELTVGNSTVAPGDSRAFLSDASGMHELPAPAGARDGHAFGVNASGIAVGDARLPDGSVHAVKYQDGMAIDLGTLSGRQNSTARAISDSGVIVGSAYDSGLRNQTAVMWVNGEITSLGPGEATAVNAAGDIAVGGLTLYRGGTTTSLGMPGSVVCISSSPFAARVVLGVNDAGWIVGFAGCRGPEEVAIDNPLIYIDGVRWNMNDLMAPGSILPFKWWASAINNAGQIAANVGLGFSTTGPALLITCARP